MEGRVTICRKQRTVWRWTGVAAWTAAPAAVWVCASVGAAPGWAHEPPRVMASPMAVADIGDAEPEPAAPPPSREAMTQLAERLAGGPAPSAGVAAPTPPSSAGDTSAGDADQPAIDNEDRPLGTVSRAGEIVSRSELPRGSDGWMLNTLASLGVVIGLILLLKWGWMKVGGVAAVGSSPVVEVLSRTAVAPRNHVLLVRVGGRVLVLGDSSAGLRTLANVDDPEEVANLLEAVTAARPTSVTRGFMQLLSQTDEAYDKARVKQEGGDSGEWRIDRARESVSGLLSRVKAMSQRGGAG
jgi:flagellar biogenesis protein FliO